MSISRLTKIVATIGPASQDPEIIKGLIEAGTNVFRLNCSHSDPETRARVVKYIREYSAQLKQEIGVLLDLQGPKIRVGKLRDGYVYIKDKNRIILSAEQTIGTEEKIGISNFHKIIDDLKPAQRVLINDGVIELHVNKKLDKHNLECEVVFGGDISDGKGVNFPDSQLVNVESFTDKDIEDLKHGLEIGVDLVALSFIRTANDIINLKKYIPKESIVRIIGKIEKPQAIDELDSILAVADGIMVARGDLGVELAYERLPAIQKQIISKANESNVLVITATQMLESMIHSPKPTRAELSDVANAVFDGTDAIMLSGETAVGKYPILAVQTMHKIAIATEEVAPRYRHDVRTVQENLARIVCELAERVQAAAIAPFTMSGTTAMLIAKQKPPVKVVALTQNKIVSQQLSLCWGITPILLTDVSDTETMMFLVEKKLLENGLIKKGDLVIVTGGLPIAARGESNFIKIHRCEGKF